MAAIADNRKTARQQSAYSHVPAYHNAPSVALVPRPRGKSAALPVASPLPMGQRGARPARIAKNLSVRSPMVAAVLCASFAVSLLCLYVTAYARVNAERLELSRLRGELKAAQRQEIVLNGEISRYHLSAPVRAQAMGLMPAPPEAVQVLTQGDAPASGNEPVVLASPRD